METEPLKNSDATLTDEPLESDLEEESDRISILQWILMFAALGAIVYLCPFLFKLFPK